MINRREIRVRAVVKSIADQTPPKARIDSLVLRPLYRLLKSLRFRGARVRIGRVYFSVRFAKICLSVAPSFFYQRKERVFTAY